MTEAATQRGQARIRNQVHDDAIWRQTINYELSTAKSWENNWGFMKELYGKDIQSKSKPQLKLPPLASSANTPRPYLSGLPSKLPSGLTTDTDSYTADLLCIHDVPRILRSLYPRQKYAYPATTQNEIGWDWERDESARTAEGVEKVIGTQKLDKEKSDVDHLQRRLAADADPNPVRFRTLERFGPYARGQGDVLKWYGGTREGLP